MTKRNFKPQDFTTEAPKHAYLKDLGSLDDLDRKRLLQIGVDINTQDRIGTFLQIDHSVVHSGSQQKGLEVMGTAKALEKYDWLQNYLWRAVPRDLDEYTKYVAAHVQQGYFIRVMPGVKATYPLQACLYLDKDGLAQCIHNIVIVEEGAELNIINGCATSHKVHTGMHLGISEFYVKKNAKLTFTMIHNWAEEMQVRPRSATVVEEGGVFLSNFVCMHQVDMLQMFPVITLNGNGAVARSHSVLVAPPNTHMDTGTRVFLRAPQAKAEIISRAVTTGGEVISRGHLIGTEAQVKAHLECHGLLLSPRGLIHAVPELEAHVAGAEMSHEAAVGKIAPEEIEYLMARGLDEETATSTIVRGFLNVRIEGLPQELQQEIDKAIEASQESFM
ncbi:MAG: SufD family Fe-S cluster assembly protein [Peptococcaceae bacterium]|nr:SufD family Fe-S cluster assembly protein [Peptococcaceae bacterium]